MIYFVALLIFILVYVVAKFLLEKVPALASLVDVLSIVLGILGALLYLGVL